MSVCTGRGEAAAPGSVITVWSFWRETGYERIYFLSVEAEAVVGWLLLIVWHKQLAIGLAVCSAVLLSLSGQHP